MWNPSSILRYCKRRPYDRPQQPRVFRGWLSWKLEWWFLAIVIFLEVGFTTTIATLALISRRHDGIASVSVVTISSLSGISFSSLGSSQLRWTLIPAIIMALFSMAYNSIVSAVAIRQPFVELKNGGPGQKNMRKTVMLDYMTYPLFYNWAIAMSHKHILLGFALLLQLLASISLTPLSATIFRAAPSQSIQDTSVTFPQEFAMDLLNSQTDMQSALNLAGAIHIDGAVASSWMNNRYAFEPFQPTELALSGNLTTKTSALSSVPDCRLVDPRETTFVFEPSDEEGIGFTTVSMADRGCNVALSIAVTPSTPMYAQTWHRVCPDNDLIVVSMGIYNNSLPVKLQNLTIVSCMPKYWNSTISLTMSIEPSRRDNPRFVSAKAENSTEIKSLAFDLIHRVLHLYIFFDPSASFRADILGKTIYKYARVLNPHVSLDSHSILKATEAVYETMFAALATENLKRPRSSPSVAPAQVTTAVERLYVNEAVAWAVVALLSGMLLCTIGLAIIVGTTTSILREEPKGLLSYARILDESDVSVTAKLFHRRYPGVDDMRGHIKSYYRKSMEEATYYFDAESGRIRMAGGGLETSIPPEPGFTSLQWWRKHWKSFRSWSDDLVRNIKIIFGTSKQLGHNLRLRRQGRRTRAVSPQEREPR